MLKKFEQKLRNRMEKCNKKKLVKCKAFALFLTFFFVAVLFFPVVGNQNSAVRAIIAKIPLSVCILCYIISVLLIGTSFKIFSIIQSIDNKNRSKEEEANYFSELQKVLSTTEYREVLYSPNLRRYCWNSTVSYEDDELIHCLNLLRNDDVTHYAILVGNSVYIISKNTAGKKIGHRTISAKEFCENYTVIEE